MSFRQVEKPSGRQLERQAGRNLETFTPQECNNDVTHAGYTPD